MPANTPDLGQLPSITERRRPLDVRGLLLGVGIGGGLVVGGFLLGRLAPPVPSLVGPELGQGTGPLENTPTGSSPIHVIKKKPLVAIEALDDLRDPTKPLIYQVTSTRPIAIYIDSNTSHSDSIRLKVPSDLRISQKNDDQIEIAFEEFAGNSKKLSININGTSPNLLDDANAGIASFSKTWFVMPVDVRISGAEGTFYLFTDGVPVQ